MIILATFALAAALAQDAPAGAASPAGETRAQAEDHAVAIHDAMDLDHDGVVTYEELAAYFVARMPKPAGGGVPKAPPFVRQMFNDADANKNGSISEWESVQASLRGFDETDANHDGVVTPEEKTAAAAEEAAAAKPIAPESSRLIGPEPTAPTAAPSKPVVGKSKDEPR